MALLWSGRFTAPPSETLRRFNDSFAFDAELLAEDVQGSQAWARALGRAGVLGAREVSRLVKALAEVAREPLPADRSAYEDVHSYVESRLGEKVGELAGKLHTGRSRNDQVATDFKLYVRAALEEARHLVLDVGEVLAATALEEAGTAMPGYTHLKRAEPITFGHWALAYVEMLLRDADRLSEASRRARECPLGSGALSGTPLPVDRQRLAEDLGFEAPTASSLDGVSDRDFAVDYLYAAALLFVHLSRLSEDLILFTTDELAFAELPDSMATGSSRMPHKKNPDVPELVRGHAGRAIGELTGLLSLLKGLALAYDKDLQLDKEPVFRVRRAVALALPALRDLLAGLTLHRGRMASAAADPKLLATALADALAGRGVPFREAHEIVGRRVAEAESLGRTLFELGPSEEIHEADLAAVDLARVLARRSATGGTSPARVAAAARAARKRIARLKARRTA